MVNAYAEAAEA